MEKPPIAGPQTPPEKSPVAESPVAILGSQTTFLRFRSNRGARLTTTDDAPAAGAVAETMPPDELPALESMEALLEEASAQLPSIGRGDVLEGVVVGIEPDEILVDIGLKAEGLRARARAVGHPAGGAPPDLFAWRDRAGLRGAAGGRRARHALLPGAPSRRRSGALPRSSSKRAKSSTPRSSNTTRAACWWTWGRAASCRCHSSPACAAAPATRPRMSWPRGWRNWLAARSTSRSSSSTAAAIA